MSGYLALLKSQFSVQDAAEQAVRVKSAEQRLQQPGPEGSSSAGFGLYDDQDVPQVCQLYEIKRLRETYLSLSWIWASGNLAVLYVL